MRSVFMDTSPTGRCTHAADEAGILLLQDFPLQWGHARSVRQQAVEQARAAVDSLGHHPSIAMWTAHDDPSVTDAGVATTGWRGTARTVAAKQLPSWNKSVLDRWVKRAFERADSSRRVVAHSGVVPHLPQLDGTDSHLWFGWRHGESEDLADFAARLPRMVRFVSEFGSDSPPADAPFIDEQLAVYEWPSLDWDHVQLETGYQRDVVERSFPPTDFDAFDEWRDALQYYQAHVLKVQIETLASAQVPPDRRVLFLVAQRFGSVDLVERPRSRTPAKGRARHGRCCMRTGARHRRSVAC